MNLEIFKKNMFNLPKKGAESKGIYREFFINKEKF